MKKTLKRILTLILAVTVIVASCSLNVFAAEKATGIAINEENFPDNNFRNYLLNGSYYIWDDNGTPIEIVYDADKDGYLSESEIQKGHDFIYSVTQAAQFVSTVELTASTFENEGVMIKIKNDLCDEIKILWIEIICE